MLPSLFDVLSLELSVFALSASFVVELPNAIFVSLHSIPIKIVFSNSSELYLFSLYSSFASINCPLTYTFWTSILFWVSVPVLSEQITDALPSVSTAGNFFTIAFFLTILWTPIARTIVDTAANPSGIAATAKLTAVINISITSLPYANPIINITIQITMAIIPKLLPSLFNFCWSGVAVSSTLFSIPAIFPTSVCIPVSTTIPFPLPYVTRLEENNIFVLSPSDTSSFSIVAASFSTGTDSPVSDASCALRFTASIILISAGT